MKLIKFRVTNFRSIDDSGWIETSDITTLIGTNESGKTNILVALWKLKPAKGGEINPIADYPRRHYHDFRALDDKPTFIEAIFELPVILSSKVSKSTNYPLEDVSLVSVSRDLSGEYSIEFPDAKITRFITSESIIQLIESASEEIRDLKPLKSEDEVKNSLINAMSENITRIRANNPSDLQKADIERILAELGAIIPEVPSKTSQIFPRMRQLLEELNAQIKAISMPKPEEINGVKTFIIANLPPFVYYSNYGNLDSEIYLPHVIENMNRPELGVHLEAKVRTLKVLFEFVKLQPVEILELGKDIAITPGHPTEDEIQRTAINKKERDILLQSASAQLTDNFRGWWQQGDYRFRFQADGSHFRIWVSDDKRPEDIELEARSSGLQWFFSFYLVFLVESHGTHKNAILLLDEPGLTLHPLAQRDLSDFFENLSTTNQILFTAHSPFMVDSDHLDRVKVVYIDEDGTTLVSSDLRVVAGKENQSHSIYPVHAALGLSVSDTLLEGCQPIVVEGTSDQHYLTSIKTYLIGKKMISPPREILFMPSGGVSGIKAIVPIISGKNEDLPFVLLDSDPIGRTMANNLKAHLYNGNDDRVLMIGEFVGFENSEIEDLFPTSFLADVITKYLRGPEEDFSEIVLSKQPIVLQVEAYAKKHELTLGPGWKVDVAKLAKLRLLRNMDAIDQSSPEVAIWKSLFTKFIS